MADLITLSRAKYNLGGITTSPTEDTTLTTLVSACSDGIQRYCGHEFNAANYDELLDGSPDTLLLLSNYPVIEVQRLGTCPTLVMRIRNDLLSTVRATVSITSTGLKLVRVASGINVVDTSVTWAVCPLLGDVVNAVNTLGVGWHAEGVVLQDYPSADLRPNYSSIACHDFWANLELHRETVTDWSLDSVRGWCYRRGGWRHAIHHYRAIYTAGYDTVPEDVQEACSEWVASCFWQTKDNPAKGPNVPPYAVQRLLLPHRRYSV